MEDSEREVKVHRARALLVQMGRLKENCREAKRLHKAIMQENAKRYDNFRQEREQILSELATEIDTLRGQVV